MAKEKSSEENSRFLQIPHKKSWFQTWKGKWLCIKKKKNRGRIHQVTHTHCPISSARSTKYVDVPSPLLQMTKLTLKGIRWHAQHHSLLKVEGGHGTCLCHSCRPFLNTSHWSWDSASQLLGTLMQRLSVNAFCLPYGVVCELLSRGSLSKLLESFLA